MVFRLRIQGLGLGSLRLWVFLAFSGLEVGFQRSVLSGLNSGVDLGFLRFRIGCRIGFDTRV